MPNDPLSNATSPSADQDLRLILGVLSAVERDSAVTQRGISTDLGIALGVANAVLKRCVRKGLIKIRAVPLRRYVYFLTPHGFNEKRRLAAEYCRISLDFFRTARTEYEEIFAALTAQGAVRVALVGISDLTEVALLAARRTRVDVVCVVERFGGEERFVGIPIARGFDGLAGKVDAVVLTDLSNPEGAFLESCRFAAENNLAESRVGAPLLLSLRRTNANEVRSVAEAAT